MHKFTFGKRILLEFSRTNNKEPTGLTFKTKVTPLKTNIYKLKLLTKTIQP